VASYESLKNLWISRDISFTLLSATVPQVLEQSIFQSLGIRNVKVFREPVVVRKELSIGVTSVILNLKQKISCLLVLLISLISTAIVKY
jgi:superfamily II DNA helicase RecQ